MIPLGGDSWTVSIGGDPDVNFCVWVLLHDGLHVHPFDRHDDGDKELRAAGLTEPRWREWLERTVRTASDRQESFGVENAAVVPRSEGVDLTGLLYGDEPPTPDKIVRARQELLARSPGARWPRQDQVREQLLMHWPQYMRHLKERDNRDVETAMKKYRLLQSLPSEEAEKILERERRLWEDLQQFRPLPPLHFYTVDYPFPVVNTVPPASAVFGGVRPDDDSEDYFRLVLMAAERLKDSRSNPSS